MEYKRKNMPCVFMLMDLLLRRAYHVPFYVMPRLKDKKLCRKILGFIYNFDVTQLAPYSRAHCPGRAIESVVQEYDDMFVLHTKL